MPEKSRDSTPKSKGVFGQRGKTPRAGLYARVSTHDQQTLPMQLSAMREYVEQRNWKMGFFALSREKAQSRDQATRASAEDRTLPLDSMAFPCCKSPTRTFAFCDEFCDKRQGRRLEILSVHREKLLAEPESNLSAG